MLYSYQQRAIEEISNHNKGLITIPTGGGKTYVFMSDAKNRIQSTDKLLTFVIVAPRILLAEQLADEFNTFLCDEEIYITHVHSGENGTTNLKEIAVHSHLAQAQNKHHFIFTTYQSLEKVNDSSVVIDIVYFDEAHHSVKPSNSVGIANTVKVADNAYFFTATPKKEMGQNHAIYGNHIVSVSAKELMSSGSILSPKVDVYEYDSVRTKENAAHVDAANIIGIVSDIEDEYPKIIVAAPSTKIIWESLTHTDLLKELNEQGYTVFHITSKHGAYINKDKVDRVKFFEELKRCGSTEECKMIVFHYSILSEGISIDGLSHCIMLRNLPTIEMLQTIGRVIRVSQKDRKALQSNQITPGEFHFYQKPCGKVIVPVSTGYGKAIQKKLQSLVDIVFEQGETLFC